MVTKTGFSQQAAVGQAVGCGWARQDTVRTQSRNDKDVIISTRALPPGLDHENGLVSPGLGLVTRQLSPEAAEGGKLLPQTGVPCPFHRVGVVSSWAIPQITVSSPPTHHHFHAINVEIRA